MSAWVRVKAGREMYFERMMKRGIKGMKGKDQKDKTTISFARKTTFARKALTFCRVRRLNLIS